MVIRPAKLEEGKILSEIALNSKAYWGYDKDFIKACREDLSVDEKYISTKAVYVLEIELHAVGFFCLSKNGEMGELEALFIEPKYIGKGLGRLLWNSILEKAGEMGIKEFTIDSDPYAEGFYRKMGAARIGEVDSTVFKDRKLPLMKVVVI